MLILSPSKLNDCIWSVNSFKCTRVCLRACVYVCGVFLTHTQHQSIRIILASSIVSAFITRLISSFIITLIMLSELVSAARVIIRKTGRVSVRA